MCCNFLVWRRSWLQRQSCSRHIQTYRHSHCCAIWRYASSNLRSEKIKNLSNRTFETRQISGRKGPWDKSCGGILLGDNTGDGTVTLCRLGSVVRKCAHFRLHKHPGRSCCVCCGRNVAWMKLCAPFSWYLPPNFGAVTWNRPRPLPAWSFQVSVTQSCISLLSKRCRYYVIISVEQSSWEAGSSSSSQKFPAFCRNIRFSMVFTRFRHFPLSWDRSAQSTPSHSIFKIQFNIIPPTHVSFQLSIFFCSRIKILYAFFLPHSCNVPCQSNFSCVQKL